MTTTTKEECIKKTKNRKYISRISIIIAINNRTTNVVQYKISNIQQKRMIAISKNHCIRAREIGYRKVSR
jgi:hypothetical protein